MAAAVFAGVDVGSGLTLVVLFLSSMAQSQSSSFLASGAELERGSSSAEFAAYFFAFFAMSSATSFSSSWLYILAVRELYFSGILPSSCCLCRMKKSRPFWFPPQSIDTSS